MKKKLFLFVFALIMIPGVVSAVGIIDDAKIGSSGSMGTGCVLNSCWQTIGGGNAIQAIRVSVYYKDGTKVSNSVDFTNRTDLSSYSFYRVSSKLSKIDYIKANDKGNFSFTSGKGANLHVISFTDLIGDSDHDIPCRGKGLSCLLKNYVNSSTDLIGQASSDFSLCKGTYKCPSSDPSDYYIVVEPATMIQLDGQYYYGTYYELKWLYNISKYKAEAYYWARSVVDKYLPNALTLANLSNFESFYTAVGLDWKDYALDKTTSDNNDSYGIGVINALNYIPKKRISIPEKKVSCPINVEINECGNSTITEPNSANCLKNNSLYQEISDCNLYCSDEITTDFNSFYNTFVGGNKYRAIQSGKYIDISGNPKITIKKTCYQTSSSTDCPNWQSSLTNKLKNDYKTNTITLNVDGDNNSGNITNGYTYELNGTPTINVNSSGATIVYEYKLDPNINKYISIATMRGVAVKSSNTVELVSSNGNIITKRASYGDSTYYLDLSNTVLNRYSSSGKKVEQTKHSTSSLITIFNNTLSINYKDVSGKEKDSYTSTGEANTNTNDMYNACSYKKYNTEDSCICGENKCCDATNCKEVECVCECKSACGCKDDGKCTPLPCPPTTTSSICDPETETCFPNVVYRPISLTNPFPGITGGGRLPGDNWNKLVRNSDGTLLKYNGNSVTAYDYYIKYNRGYNDYEVYQAEPLYVIKLDPKTMKEIRSYNKVHKNDYNDFELSCQNGEKCISKFLRGQASGFGINLINSGTCKDITASTFDSCISRKQ